MRLLIRFGLIAVVGLWLAVEFASVPFAERMIEQEVNGRYRDAASVKADISSFPLVSRVLLTEEIKKLTITLDRIARRTIDYAEVSFELSGIVIDRSATLAGNPRVRRMDRGKVTAKIDVAALEGIPSLSVADVRVDGRMLVAGTATAEIDKELVPCQPQAQVNGDQIVLTCEIDEVPQTLLDAAQGS